MNRIIQQLHFVVSGRVTTSCSSSTSNGRCCYRYIHQQQYTKVRCYNNISINGSIMKRQVQQQKQQRGQSRMSTTMNHSNNTKTNLTTNTTTTTTPEMQQQQQMIIDVLAQKAAYAKYGKHQLGIKGSKKKNTIWTQFKQRIYGSNTTTATSSSLLQKNINTAWYALAIGIGALGASYAAVPLYKVFCQTTGFGGTTQRVLQGNNDNNDENNDTTNNQNSTIINANQQEYESTIEVYLQKMASSILPSGTAARVHTWTDVDAMERLRSLKPVNNADMITIRFDTTVTDIMPWTFVPVQLDVKVVPGETALSFFRVTNHSNKAITGVATYNVHPPKVGIYFQKIQCFCFEEQRLLPGETVDMPVFFFIDPDIINDPQVSYVRSVTLSYTFFPTDEDDETDGITIVNNNNNHPDSATTTAIHANVTSNSM